LQDFIRHSIQSTGQRAFYLFSLLVFFSICIAAIQNNPVFLVIPGILLVIFLGTVSIKTTYLLIWAMIPFSTEIYFANGLGTDFPSEPLILLVATLGFLYLLHKARRLNYLVLFHPVTLLLFLHLIWIFMCTLQSDNIIVSLKFTLAKSWYIFVFYILGIYFIRSTKDFTVWIRWFLIPLLITIVIISIRHSFLDFSFKDVNEVVGPFYRNHVNYACVTAVFFPFLWFSRKIVTIKKKFPFWWLAAIALCLFAIQFAYTRAAYVSLLIGAITYFIIRFKLVKYALVAAGLSAVLIISVMAYQNKYIDYAPDYSKTIVHDQFGNLIEATYNLEDISTMERIHRWIAGLYMIKEKPVFGYGPGNFYNFYHSYTDQNFLTYVSDNPDRSGIHNYYLMTAVEQGLPGLLIFVFLCCYTLLFGEKLYHDIRNPERKAMAMAALLSFIVILSILILNDMVETDKIGSFFFFVLALLVGLDLRNKIKNPAPAITEQ
jgi:hypothetical protein